LNSDVEGHKYILLKCLNQYLNKKIRRLNQKNMALE